MAQFIDFPESNLTFGGWEEDGDRPEVGNLRVFKSEETFGKPIASSTSCWKLTEEELAEVAQTGLIWLTVLGDGHPAVFVMGTRPDFQGGEG